MLICSSFI